MILLTETLEAPPTIPGSPRMWKDRPRRGLTGPGSAHAMLLASDSAGTHPERRRPVPAADAPQWASMSNRHHPERRSHGLPRDHQATQEGAPMNARSLGDPGLQVSAVGLGCMTMTGGYGGRPDRGRSARLCTPSWAKR